MIKLDKTFPTMDCSACILTSKMVEVAQHPNIDLLSYSEVESVAGHVGDFKATVKKKARFVDFNKCTGCEVCTEVCPSKAKNDYNYDMDTRKAPYIQFPQTSLKKAQIDSANCLYFKSMEKTGKPACQIRQEGIPAKNLAGCQANAINSFQKDGFIDLNIGAILLATGFKHMPKDP